MTTNETPPARSLSSLSSPGTNTWAVDDVPCTFVNTLIEQRTDGPLPLNGCAIAYEQRTEKGGVNTRQ